MVIFFKGIQSNWSLEHSFTWQNDKFCQHYKMEYLKYLKHYSLNFEGL